MNLDRLVDPDGSPCTNIAQGPGISLIESVLRMSEHTAPRTYVFYPTLTERCVIVYHHWRTFRVRGVHANPHGVCVELSHVLFFLFFFFCF
eukprot:SAG11_NODE_47_length_20431_cov_7.472752_15_plen_91_part_00